MKRHICKEIRFIRQFMTSAFLSMRRDMIIFPLVVQHESFLTFDASIPRGTSLEVSIYNDIMARIST